MTLDPVTGWIDFAYVAPEAMGQGVAETLYAVLEGRMTPRASPGWRPRQAFWPNDSSPGVAGGSSPGKRSNAMACACPMRS